MRVMTAVRAAYIAERFIAIMLSILVDDHD
jgi:hypothetical protein